jgi:hypothetical protein
MCTITSGFLPFICKAQNHHSIFCLFYFVEAYYVAQAGLEFFLFLIYWGLNSGFMLTSRRSTT